MIKLAMFGFALLQAAAGVAAPGTPQFDAASVKPAALTSGPVIMNSDAGRIDYRQFGLKALVWVAFQVTLPQIVWPAWMAGNTGGSYDITATFPPGTTEEQQHIMLQSLLADRFKLAVHRETRDAKVYALVISSRGLKIRKSDNPPDDKTLSISVRSGKDGFHLNDRLPDAPASAPYGITISKLVKYFNNGYLDRVMVDRTGLEGYYDINLFIPPEVEAGNPSLDQSAKPPVTPSVPTYFDALEKQLGLKVGSQTAPIEILVIDHLERTPTAN